MEPYYRDADVHLYHGDCLEVLRCLPAESVDAVVTDPPAGISFMGRDWDHHKGGREQWSGWLAEVMRECWRVAKPGAHAIVWSLPRTSHWTACGLEDAGWEVRDRISHLFGSGFPKSPTALKPAVEDWWVARKPLSGTVAANVLAYGTGALNIEGCRVATDEDRARPPRTPNAIYGGGNGTSLGASESNPAGRWPTNVVLSHAGNDVDGDLCTGGCVPGCPVAELDRQSGFGKTNRPSSRGAGGQHGTYSPIGAQQELPYYADEGGASRFFPVFRYEAKASAAERPRVDGEAHATVKPLDLMRWLVRLVTPPGGTVLEPFAGSGTTIEACLVEGFRCIAVEREARYLPLIMARISKPIESVLPFDAPEVSDAVG